MPLGLLIVVVLFVASILVFHPLVPERAPSRGEQQWTPGDAANTHFIFLNGLGCSSDGSCYNYMGFEEIRRALGQAGFSFRDKRFLLYSYTGGKIEEGRWYPQPYSPVDSGQPLAVSVGKLEEMIEQYSRVYPEACFILIGHSLGGRIALDFMSKTKPELQGKVKGVVTLNSPLLGAGSRVPHSVRGYLEKNESLLASPVAQQLMSEFYRRNKLAAIRRETVKKLQNNGVRIATFSTYQDLFVRPYTGCIMDEKGNPVTEGYIINTEGINLNDVVGHSQILEHPAVLRYILSLCPN